mmetsp:Transcript_38090/g.75537  ORF Transcript_38090/g.75537 Transcript_38090/m.75537 type:complete len:205 (+) Transcript_38090:158-772(+)
MEEKLRLLVAGLRQGFMIHLRQVVKLFTGNPLIGNLVNQQVLHALGCQQGLASDLTISNLLAMTSDTLDNFKTALGRSLQKKDIGLHAQMHPAFWTGPSRVFHQDLALCLAAPSKGFLRARLKGSFQRLQRLCLTGSVGAAILKSLPPKMPGMRPRHWAGRMEMRLRGGQIADTTVQPWQQLPLKSLATSTPTSAQSPLKDICR